MAKLLDRLARAFGFNQQPHMLTSSGMILNVLNENSARVAKYDQNWQTYFGEDIRKLGKNKEDKTADQPEVNFIRRNIDKINWWAFGRKFSVINADYQEEINTAMRAWGSRMVERLLQIGQFGSVCGDVMLIAAPHEISQALGDGKLITDKIEITEDTKLSIVALNPGYCTPIYNPFDTQILSGMSIDIPVREFDVTGTWLVKFQHITITPAQVLYEIRDNNGAALPGTRVTMDNPVGVVYALHIRNRPVGDALYGADDIREASKLNATYNEKLTSTGEIIDYHGAPITLVFGARANNLTRGPNKIWGNLPKDGKVETLELQSDLAANNEYIKAVRQDLHTLMGVPEIAQGVQQAISNTSGVALHTMYMPMIERVHEKWEVYGPQFVEIVIIVLRWLEYLGRLTTTDARGRTKKLRTKPLTENDYERIRMESVIKFELPLPKDRLIEAQIQQTRLVSGTQSIRGALIALGEGDPESRMAEIEEDKKKALDNAQKMTAATGAVEAEEGDDTAEESGTPSSGAEGDNGENKGTSEAQQGRPKGTTKG